MPTNDPSTIGPVFTEPGFFATGGYAAAGFQATVNKFGGNLLVSATDVEIPHQGLIGLWFRRTHNSNVLQYAPQTILDEIASDSPLGEGWTSHYGLLWTAAPNVFRPVFIDNSGARHLFYPHTVLNGVLPINSAGSHPTFISAQLEILRCTDTAAAKWELLEPSGLRISFEKLAQYEFLVPVRITDAFGNSLTITYEAYGGVYFQHPLPKKVTDGLNRSLEFSYVSKAGKKRLWKILFEGRILSQYTYDTNASASSGTGSAPSTADRAYLKTHESGAGRLTTYTVELTAAGPALGTIKAIQAPTGGITTFEYELRRVFYKPDAIEYLYVVTKIKRGGGVWTYSYLNSTPLTAELPTAPSGNEFTVVVTANGFSGPEFAGNYVYYGYGQSTTLDGTLWKVGLLLESDETVLGGVVKICNMNTVACWLRMGRVWTSAIHRFLRRVLPKTLRNRTGSTSSQHTAISMIIIHLSRSTGRATLAKL